MTKWNPSNEEPDNDKWEPANEFPTTEQTRNEKIEAAETLCIVELDASITKLTEHVSELSTTVADLDAGVAEVTTLRPEARATSTPTIKDAGEAQTAVAHALIALKESYTKRQRPPPLNRHFHIFLSLRDTPPIQYKRYFLHVFVFVGRVCVGAGVRGSGGV